MAARCGKRLWISGLRVGVPMGALAACACMIPGCAGPVAARARQPAYPGQGFYPIAMVMMKPHPEPLGGVDEAAAIDATRRDVDLNVRTPGPMLASDRWPEPARPSVENTWYISLPSNANTSVFFLPPHGSRRGY